MKALTRQAEELPIETSCVPLDMLTGTIKRLPKI